MAIKLKLSKKKQKVGVGVKTRRAVAWFLGFFFAVSTLACFEEGFDSYRYYQSQMEASKVFAENIYYCTPEDEFVSLGVISDDSGYLSSYSRSQIKDYFEEIYDYSGVQMVLKLVSEEDAKQMSEDEREQYAKEYMENLRQETSNNGANLSLLVIFADSENPKCLQVSGSEAKKTMRSLDSVDSYFERGICKSIENGAEADTIKYDIIWHYEDLAKALQNPAEYYASDLKYYKDSYKGDFGSGTVCLLLTALNAWYLIFSSLGLSFAAVEVSEEEKAQRESKKSRRLLSEKEKLTERDEFLKRSLESFEEPGELSAEEDVDNEENSLHDLVEKYGGFSEDAESISISEEKSATGRS